MLPNNQTEDNQINSWLVLFALSVTILFQITAYKFIWGIELLSRITNISVLVLFSLFALVSLVKFKYSSKVFYFYIFPGALVYLGFFANIAVNSVGNLNVINQFGQMIPWAVYLAIPGLVKSRQLNVSVLWRYFHYFMLISVGVSVVEYFAIFNGYVAVRAIETSGGPFFAAYFSMLYGLENGEIYYRFYSSFMEPGTLAMYLLPVIAYAFFHAKYFSMTFYISVLVLTDSLGGYVGLAMLLPLIVYFRFHGRALLPIGLGLITSSIVLVSFSTPIIDRYSQKNLSASVREDNVTGMLSALPDLVLTYPLGLPLSESTMQAQENSNYFGSNFTPGNAFNFGGLYAFLGYIGVLGVSLFFAVATMFRRKLSTDEKVIAISILCLIPFIIQRTVVWDSNIFALLFAPVIVEFLSSRRRLVTDVGFSQDSRHLAL